MEYVFYISHPHEGAIESFSKRRDCETLAEAEDYFNELLDQFPPGPYFYLCKFYEWWVEPMLI